MKEWQKKWDDSIKGRKLYAMVPKIGKENKINFHRKKKINTARLGVPTIENIGKSGEYCRISPCDIEHIIETCPAHIPRTNELKKQCHESNVNFSTTIILSPSAPDEITKIVQNLLREVGSPL